MMVSYIRTSGSHVFYQERLNKVLLPLQPSKDDYGLRKRIYCVWRPEYLLTTGSGDQD